MKFSAEDFSRAGDQYLGRSYTEMDCQAFVEQCMRDVGLKKDLAGSNSWYREVSAHGWTGTPEECVRVFGCVPKGALLFILANDGKEPAKFRADGIGNASHIGIKTGRGDGAIHSSSSRGRVCTSKFMDKSIRGGWNRVGLYDKFDYGKSVNWVLEHIGIGQEPAGADPAGGEEKMQGKVIAESGGTVKLRQKPSTSCATYWDIPVGTELEILERGDEWSHCVASGRIGWMKNEFIQIVGAGDPAAGDQDPAEDFGPGDLNTDDGNVMIRISVKKEEAAVLLQLLDSISWQLVQAVGRG